MGHCSDNSDAMCVPNNRFGVGVVVLGAKEAFLEVKSPVLGFVVTISYGSFRYGIFTRYCIQLRFIAHTYSVI